MPLEEKVMESWSGRNVSSHFQPPSEEELREFPSVSEYLIDTLDIIRREMGNTLYKNSLFRGYLINDDEGSIAYSTWGSPEYFDDEYDPISNLNENELTSSIYESLFRSAVEEQGLEVPDEVPRDSLAYLDFFNQYNDGVFHAFETMQTMIDRYESVVPEDFATKVIQPVSETQDEFWQQEVDKKRDAKNGEVYGLSTGAVINTTYQQPPSEGLKNIK